MYCRLLNLFGLRIADKTISSENSRPKRIERRKFRLARLLTNQYNPTLICSRQPACVIDVFFGGRAALLLQLYIRIFYFFYPPSTSLKWDLHPLLMMATKYYGNAPLNVFMPPISRYGS